MAGNPRLRGVLRHKLEAEANKDKFEDLLVFGYACKLFRDDEKAASIDQGDLLIPWMGDESIKIDRYDARGTLFDLKPLEIPPGGYDRYEGLTAEERRVEQLCDEERYFALYKDEAEEAVIKEEEIKRLNQDLDEVTSEEKSYHQVPFSYGESQQKDSANTNPTTTETPVKSIVGELGDAVYVPPPLLDIPPDMVVPPTRKLARIIEKTAQFISSQGTQMEIVVKAKQANNPMFAFLHFDCELHPFYRHILSAIRNGTYVVPTDDQEAAAETNGKADQGNGQNHVSDDSESDSGYLHPSLQPKIPEEPAPAPSVATPTEQVSSMFPPAEIRPLVDKTASYMAKNGRHLEAVVLSKGDARFAFLNEAHTFHPYYIHKLTIYAAMLKSQQSAILLAVHQQPRPPLVPQEQTTKSEKVGVASSSDPEAVKSDRRKRAALFLDKMKKDRVAARERIDKEDDDNVETESTRSSVTKSKSRTPDDIEIIDAPSSPRESRERSVHSRTVSPSPQRKKVRRNRSRSRQRTHSRSRGRSTSRTRRRSPTRSRSRSRHRKSPSPDRNRRHHKKHRSRDRHRREKKKRRSRDRLRKKSRRKRSNPRSLSRSPSGSGSPSYSSRSRTRSRTPATRSRSPSDEPRCSPITSAVRKMAAEASKSGSETSSPLPTQLLTVQPAFNKIAEGIRAKVIAMIEGSAKK